MFTKDSWRGPGPIHVDRRIRRRHLCDWGFDTSVWEEDLLRRTPIFTEEPVGDKENLQDLVTTRTSSEFEFSVVTNLLSRHY